MAYTLGVTKMPGIDKFANAIKGGGAAPAAPGPQAPPSMENQTDQYRPRVEALDPAAKTDLILDLFNNITTDEIEAALNEYAAAPGGMAGGGMAGEV